jgi:peptidoglycan/xylan/chitin deacetylase (PgdA/CDA1 family)
LKKSQLLETLLLALIIVSSSLSVNLSLADSIQPHGVISITFDDGWQNQYSYAFPLMEARGIVGTFYVVTSHVDTNITGSTYLSFAELQTMQNSGNEIASHSVSHPDFTTISDSQIRQECITSKQVLQSRGLTVNNFAYPFGAYNGNTDSLVSQYYRSARDVYNHQIVLQLPYSQFHLPADAGDGGDPGLLSSLQAIVNQVYSTNAWAVIYFHQILPNVANSPEVINSQTFASFLDYIQSKGVQTLTVNKALDLASPPGSIAISPISVGMDIGQSQTFSSSISGLNQIISYQWYLNSSAVSGATTPNWTFRPSSTGNFIVYLNVTDNLGHQVQSNIVTNIVVYSQPSVSVNPSVVNLTSVMSQTFVSTVLGGNPPYTYQWYLNGTALSAATNANYMFAPTLTGIYNFYVNVTDNAAITVSSNNSTVKVVPPTNVAITPTQLILYTGQPQTFNSTVVEGTMPYAYQWVLNDSAISGANSENWLFIPQSTGAYKVYLNVTDGFNLKAQSNIVTEITVYPQLTVSITPTSANMNLNTNQQFNSNVTGGLALFTYQWYFANGSAISGATTSNLAYTATSIGTFSIYLNVTDSLNSRTQSNTAIINVTPSSPTPNSSTSDSTPSPTSDPNSSLTPTITSTSTETPADTSTSSSTPTQSNVTLYYIAGAIVVIAVILVAADLLVIRKRLLSSSPHPPPQSEEFPPPPPPPE